MKTDRRALIGILLVILGSLFLLRNFDLIPDLPRYIFSWENIFLVIALINLISGKLKPALILGLLWLFFALDRHFYIDMHQYWPVFLILLGIIFIFRNRSNRNEGVNAESYFDDINIFGGGVKQFTSQTLEGGSSTNIFGGSTLDLREALPVDGAVIDVTSIFGACEIIVPENWNVSVSTTSIFGGFEDKRVANAEKQNFTLHIKGISIFGGGKIKTNK